MTLIFRNLLLVGLQALVASFLLSLATNAAEVQSNKKTSGIADTGSKSLTRSTLVSEKIGPFDQSPAVSDLSDPQQSKQVQAAPKKSGGNKIPQVTSVSELSDVQPTDWAFQAVQSLVERYGCIEGFPDKTFRGNQSATRFELAAALNACLNQISERFVTAEDLTSLRALQEEFAAELATLRGQVDGLEARTAEVEANQFSTTTKLNGEAIFALGYPFGDNVAVEPGEVPGSAGQINEQLVFSDRVRLTFDTSFTGKDRLRTRLEAGNFQSYDTNITGTNMTRLGFDIDSDNGFALDELNYRFPLGERGRLKIDANAGEYQDNVNTFNPYLESSGSGAISRFGRFNPIYRQGGGGAGATLEYGFGEKVGIALGYLADEAPIFLDDNTGLGRGGLIGGSYAALAQLEFTPSDIFQLGLTYVRSYDEIGNVNQTGSTGSRLARRPFGNDVATSGDHLGAEAVFQPSSRFALTGWVGYSFVRSETGPNENADLLNYAVALNFPDLGREGSLGAIIFGQPPKVINNSIVGNEDPDTSYHLEGLYKYKVTDNIAITPGILAIFNPEHNADNNTIFVGTVRTTFSF